MLGTDSKPASEARLPGAMELSGLNPAYREDRHPILDRLRREAPRHVTDGSLVLTTQGDARQALADPELSRDPFKAAETSLLRFTAPREMMSGQRPPAMLWMDDPEHALNRGLIQPAFFRRCAGMRARIEAILADLLDALAAKGKFEAIVDLAVPLPVYVIGDILGLPRADMPLFRRLSNGIASLNGNPFRTAEQEATLRASDAELDAYLRAIITARRARPGEDLISDLVAADLGGVSLSDGDIVSACWLLLLAGNLTTTDLIGNGIVLLLDHPAELAKLRADPRLARGAVEEVLRYAPPVMNVRRDVIRDQAVLGCPMHRGDGVVTSIDACNRDPAVFDDPHAFRIERTKNDHMAFGGGAHQCLGAPLARLEGEIVFARLFARFPDLRLLERPVRRPAPVFTGYEAIRLSAGR